MQPSMGCPDCQKNQVLSTVIRRRQTTNRKSASPIGAVNGAMPLRGDFRAFPQEQLPYTRERSGAQRPVTGRISQKSGRWPLFLHAEARRLCVPCLFHILRFERAGRRAPDAPAGGNAPALATAGRTCYHDLAKNIRMEMTLPCRNVPTWAPAPSAS